MQYRSLLLKILSAVIVFGSWEIAGRVPVSYAFPTFFESMHAMVTLTLDGTMFAAYTETLKPLAVGLAISTVPGIGLTSKVFVVCIMAMPVIVLNTAGAVRNTPVSLKEMGTSFLAKDRDILLKIIIPAASPVIFSGLRLGVSAGFIGAILSELKITPTAVGDIITYSRSIADYPSMYAAIFSIILLAVLFLNLLEKIEVFLFNGNVRGYVSD